MWMRQIYSREYRISLEEWRRSCEKSGIAYEIDDKRSKGHPIHAEFIGELRESQKLAVEKLLQYDSGILNAATAFGKTVVCCDVIAKRQVSTLILLQSSALMEQWQEALEKFLHIDEELPLQEADAKYVYGVIATPFRGDGLEK